MQSRMCDRQSGACDWQLGVCDRQSGPVTDSQECDR